jgi:hypothetical protein
MFLYFYPSIACISTTSANMIPCVKCKSARRRCSHCERKVCKKDRSPIGPPWLDSDDEPNPVWCHDCQVKCILCGKPAIYPCSAIEEDGCNIGFCKDHAKGFESGRCGNDPGCLCDNHNTGCSYCPGRFYDINGGPDGSHKISCPDCDFESCENAWSGCPKCKEEEEEKQKHQKKRKRNEARDNNDEPEKKKRIFIDLCSDSEDDDVFGPCVVCKVPTGNSPFEGCECTIHDICRRQEKKATTQTGGCPLCRPTTSIQRYLDAQDKFYSDVY